MSSWPLVRIDQVCELRPQKSEARNRVNPTDLVSFVPMNDLPVDRMWLSAIGTRPLSDVEGSYTYFADGDVLLAKITPCFENGKLGIAQRLTNGVGFGSSEFFVLRPSERLLAEYLYYFLSQAEYREHGASMMTGAVGHRRVPKEFVEGTLLPLPPLAEQKRIVAILDEAFEGIAKAIANAERNLANAREVFDWYAQKIFDSEGSKWSSATLGEIYDVRDGTHDSPTYQVDGYPLITSKNLKRDGLNFENVKMISGDDFKRINQRSQVDRGDVLLAMIGTIGNPVVVIDEPEFAIKNVALIKVPQHHNSHFLRYYLSTANVVRKMQRDAKGTTQKFVGLGYLREFPIKAPNLEEQQRIVRLLDQTLVQTNNLEANYKSFLALITELKTSILTKAFSGQLTGKEAVVA